jgi:GNAT superfamily N-acetyltransferase
VARYTIEPGDAVADKEDVLALGKRNLPSFTEARYSRYYEHCPIAETRFWIARESTSGAAVGMLALIPALLQVDGRSMLVGHHADLAVDEGHRGFGPAPSLMQRLIDELPSTGVEAVLGMANDASEGLVLRFGYAPVGRFLGLVKPIRFDRVLERAERLRPSVRPYARVLEPFHRVRSRERRGLLRGRALRVETLPGFDQRFGELWRRASSAHRVVGERSATYLNWKYGLDRKGGRDRDLLTVFERDDLAGYAVTDVRGGLLTVDDLLVRAPGAALDRLLAWIVALGRRRGVEAVAFRYLGPESFVTARMRSFGFLRWTRGQLVLVRVTDRFTGDTGALEPSCWSLVGGDRDI